MDKGATASVTECWVLFNFMLAWLLMFGAGPVVNWSQLPHWASGSLRFIFLVYPLLRVAEIIVFQIWTQILGGYRGKAPRTAYTVVGLRRSVVLAGLLYIETMAWFAAMYSLLPERFSNGVVRCWYGALYYSAVTMTTTGFGEITPTHPTTYVLVTAHILVGWGMIVLIVSRVVANLPRLAGPRSARGARLVRAGGLLHARFHYALGVSTRERVRRAAAFEAQSGHVLILGARAAWARLTN